MSHDQDTISVIHSAPEDLEGSKSFGSPKRLPAVGEVNTSTLGRNLRRLTSQINEIFDEVSAAPGEFELTSFDVAVEVTGSGEVRLIGAVSLELTGGISLTFTRRPRHEPSPPRAP